jgi:hypothetical protein
MKPRRHRYCRDQTDDEQPTQGRGAGKAWSIGVERIPLVVNRNPFNTGYLNTKASKLGHWISEGGDQPDLEAAQSDGAADSAPTMQS